MGADGEVFGVLEEALAGGILPQAVGEVGHGVEPAPVDGEGAHVVEGRGFPIDGAGGRAGGAFADTFLLGDAVARGVPGVLIEPVSCEVMACATNRSSFFKLRRESIARRSATAPRNEVTSAAQLPGVVGPEGLTPLPDRLVRDGDPAFGEQIFYVAEAQAKAVVEPDCVTDDLGRKAVVAVAWRRACHWPTLPATGSS